MPARVEIQCSGERLLRGLRRGDSRQEDGTINRYDVNNKVPSYGGARSGCITRSRYLLSRSRHRLARANCAAGYSRELPGNTHAEECALAKLAGGTFSDVCVCLCRLASPLTGDSLRVCVCVSGA